jgi:hypothetical protein
LNEASELFRHPTPEAAKRRANTRKANMELLESQKDEEVDQGVTALLEPECDFGEHAHYAVAEIAIEKVGIHEVAQDNQHTNLNGCPHNTLWTVAC